MPEMMAMEALTGKEFSVDLVADHGKILYMAARMSDSITASIPMEATLFHDEKAYEIAKTVSLGKIDYDNFCTDMLADRQFIEDYYDLCGVGTVWKCLFVHQRGRTDGILIVPTDNRYVKYAAYLPE